MIRVDETDPVGEVEPSFPYRDVTVRRGIEFKDHYDIQSEIGRGKFGTVYRCKDKGNGLMLAAKVVNTSKKEDRRAVEREVEIMRRLQHPRLIQLYDAIDTGRQIYVILELIEGGELFERVIDDDFILTERSCAVFMRQICEGIEFIHAQNILHLDLKPENILCLTKEGNRIKIIDFGLARQYDPKKKLQVLFGTPEFVAPEVVNFDQIGYGTDMWSVGVICYVLLSGLSPFMGDTDIETMANVTIAKYDFDHDAFADISEDAKDFIRCLLVKDKEKRATGNMCRKHRWLATTRRPGKPIRQTVSKDIAAKDEGRNVQPPKSGDKEHLACSSSSMAPTTLEEKLDLTKDNLRLFVERWREHPDSPYMLDELSNSKLFFPDIISGKKVHESASLRCYSPSPCESICSTLSEATTIGSYLGDNPDDGGGGRGRKGTFLLSVPNLNLQSLERRASEGTTLEKRDPASQIMLAEEIIKLSEHLRSIAGVGSSKIDTSAPLNDNDESIQEKDHSNGSQITNSHRVLRKSSTGSNNSNNTSVKERNEIKEKLSSIKEQRILNGTTFHSCHSRRENDLIKTTFKLNKPRQTNEQGNREDSTRTEETIPSTWLQDNHSTSIDLIPPWRRSRVRHFGETSRDVPRINDLRDLHKNLSLDEPNSTKDLLLRLLGEWEDVVRTKPSGIGRKSVSVDWCGEESIARKTINSLAEYFQSEQQRNNGPTTAVVDATSPQTSIHR